MAPLGTEALVHMKPNCWRMCHYYDLILVPTYKKVWPYFKQINLIFPVLVLAYELQSPTKVYNTNSYLNLEICMTILQTASLSHWQHHFWHTNKVSFQKYLILIPAYEQKFVWPYFKQIDLIYPALVFAYELQSPWKVCSTNPYVNLEICLTILQTASLCCWQHQFWHTNTVTFQSILLLIPTYKHKFVWPYFKKIDLIFPTLVFAYELQSPSKVYSTNSYINLGICMTILQTASLCC